MTEDIKHNKGNDIHLPSDINGTGKPPGGVKDKVYYLFKEGPN